MCGWKQYLGNFRGTSFSVQCMFRSCMYIHLACTGHSRVHHGWRFTVRFQVYHAFNIRLPSVANRRQSRPICCCAIGAFLSSHSPSDSISLCRFFNVYQRVTHAHCELPTMFWIKWLQLCVFFNQCFCPAGCVSFQMVGPQICARRGVTCNFLSILCTELGGRPSEHAGWNKQADRMVYMVCRDG